MNKLKLIIFTGIDGTGKSTIKKAFEKKSKWKHICLDRFVDSIVYDKVYNRKTNESSYLRLESDLNIIADVYLIYLKCDLKISIDRITKDKKEKLTEKDIENLDKAKLLFENDYLKKTCFNFVEVDTGKYNINQCVNKILKFIERR